MVGQNLIKERRSHHFKTFVLPEEKGHQVAVKAVGPFDQSSLESACSLEDLKNIMVLEKPVLLHWTGGPGLAVPTGITRVVNTRHFHLLQVNYRGTVESKPTGKTEYNTTQDLIADGIRLLDALEIDRFYMSGFCFGTLIATVMAAQMPERCKGLGLFFPYTSSQLDDQWLFDDVQHIDSEKSKLWRSFSAKAGTQKGAGYISLLDHYADAIEGGDIEAIKKYAIYQSAITGCINLPESTDIDNGLGELNLTRDQENQVSMELHYARNQYFLGSQGVVPYLPNLQNVPTHIVYSSKNASFHPDSINLWKQNLKTAQYRDTGSMQHHMLDNDHKPFARQMFAFLEDLSKPDSGNMPSFGPANYRLG